MHLDRSKLLLLAAAVVSVGAGTAFTKVAQDEPKAETVYKNIQVFKGQPASQIDPTMHAISLSLGVRCSFCHVRTEDGKWDFASDSKDEKKTARQMILMMNKINADNFEGRMEVTCTTCHQGRSEPSRAIPLAPPREEAPRPGANAPSLPAADEVVAKYEAAIGGSAAVKGLAGIHAKGTITQGNEPAMPVELFAKSSGPVAMVLTMPQGVFRMGFDGSTAWRKFGNQGQTLTGAELDMTKASSPFAKVNLRSQYSSFGRVRKDMLDGNEVLVVSGMQEGKPFTRLYFDAQSGLLIRKSTSTQTLVGMVPSTEDYSDYSAVGGVMVAHKIVETGAEGTSTMVLTTVEANPTIPDSQFKMP